MTKFYVDLSIPASEVIDQIPPTVIVEHVGTNDLLDYMDYETVLNFYGGRIEIAEELDTSDIDNLFLQRHPNPSEVLDYIDDEQIIDYLINKGYNIEM